MLKKKNFAKSTLASGITAAATQLTIATGEGTKFPSSGKFRAVLWAEAYINPSDDPNAEIVEAELSSGDTFDITRGEEGTSGHAWSASDNFAHTITAGTLTELEDEITQRPAFSVHRNGTNQSITSNTWTKVEFTTEEFDTNSDFDSTTNYRFTPTVAGKYLLSAFVKWATQNNLADCRTALYKNGVLYKQAYAVPGNASVARDTIGLSAVVDANGSTDYFEVYVRISTSGDSVDGASESTFFTGSKI
jgi:hypothetical protein